MMTQVQVGVMVGTILGGVIGFAVGMVFVLWIQERAEKKRVKS